MSGERMELVAELLIEAAQAAEALGKEIQRCLMGCVGNDRAAVLKAVLAGPPLTKQFMALGSACMSLELQVLSILQSTGGVDRDSSSTVPQ